MAGRSCKEAGNHGDLWLVFAQVLLELSCGVEAGVASADNKDSRHWFNSLLSLNALWALGCRPKGEIQKCG